MELEAGKIAELHHEIKKKRPVIHCITNAVTVNDCANILLAAGASPTMAHHPLEVEEITEGAAALVCNLGAIADFEAMEKAGKKADEMGHAIVLDPVGISGSTYRRMQCQTLIKEIHPTCIRGNYSEIRALLKDCNTVTGVDASDKSVDVESMKQYAKVQKTILIASGAVDVITDGVEVFECRRGHEMMAHITGSGCMSSVMLGAFLGPEATIEAAAACCSFIGLCGEAAAEKTKECQGGTMTFRNVFIDEVSLMTPEKIYGRYQEK